MADALSASLDLIYNNEIEFLVQTKSGECKKAGTLGDTTSDQLTTIYSGTFDPLHEGHLELFETAREVRGSCVFELSISNYTKGFHPRERIEKVAAQFVGRAPLLVTRSRTFVEKEKLFDWPVAFVLGADIFEKILEYDPKPISHLLVANRVIDGETLHRPAVSLDDDKSMTERGWLPLEKRFGDRAKEAGISWEELPIERIDISSSELREKE
jgi:hypothetical protein